MFFRSLGSEDDDPVDDIFQESYIAINVGIKICTQW